MTRRTSHGRPDRRYAVASAAIRLFMERGLDATTVDDIAAEARVSPRTFFRYFTSKESAAFPDHADRVADLRQRLDSRRPTSSPIEAALDVCRQSALAFFDDPELYRPRYQLVRSVRALRDFERVADAAYEQVIAEFIEAEIGTGPVAAMTARAFAASVVAVVNYTLEVWASQEDVDAPGLLEAGLQVIGERFGSPSNALDSGQGPPSKPDLVIFVPGSDELRDRILKMVDGSHKAIH